MSGQDLGKLAPELLASLQVPVVGCDEQGRICYANPAFEKLLNRPSVPPPASPETVADVAFMGEDIHEFFGIPWEKNRGEWRSPSGSGWLVEIHAAASGHVVWLRESATYDTRVSTSERHDGVRFYEDSVEMVIGQLSRELALPKRDEELIQFFVSSFQKMLPGRLFCVRLFAQDTGKLMHVFATGRLKENGREKIGITRQSFDQVQSPDAPDMLDNLDIVSEYEVIFQNGIQGFDVPLHDGKQLMGLLSVEYTEETDAFDRDMRLVEYVSLHFSTTLRYARMLGESMYLRDYLVQLLDNANAPILVTDRQRRVKIINRAFERLTGHDRKDVLDQDVMQFLPEAERKRFLRAVVNALNGRTTRTLEVRIPHKSGKGKALIALSTAAVRSGFGEIEGVVAVGQDLTELRQLQHQIIHSEKLATIGQLAAGVVHELNNPLTSISVYSEYLLKKLEREGAEPGDVTKLQRICEGADRILKFTRDLVAYARPAGEEPRLVDLADVVERSLVFCEHVVDRAGVSVETQFAEKLPKVYGVKGQLQQILVNLITNACDAKADSDGRLRVAIRHVGDHVELTVTDSGPGIPAQDREQIFEPFFTTKPEGKGTGLGLSIVRNIITNHNGSVKAVAAEDGGTSFVIELFASA